MALNHAKINNTRAGDKPIKLTDGNGLYIEIKPNGSKLWRYRYKIGGKENTFAIGEYPLMGLAAARLERTKARELVKQGINPAHNRQLALSSQLTENENTFQIIANEWRISFEAKKGWSPYYASQVKHILETDVFPYVGKLPIRNITSSHMLSTLERIEKRGAHTVASLAYLHSSAVFSYAISRRRTDNNPMICLKGVIQKPKPKHHAPLSRKEIPTFLQKLEEDSCNRETYIAIRLMLLVFTRTKEMRMAPWSEFDLDNAEWRIPAERMKRDKGLIIPLPAQAVKLLEELQTLSGNQKWLFPNVRRPLECMCSTTINRVIGRMGYKGAFSGHGFRSTASTILNEMGFPADYIEKQLAHTSNNVRAIYNQAQYLTERRSMLQTWADFIDGLCTHTNVIPINRKAA